MQRASRLRKSASNEMRRMQACEFVRFGDHLLLHQPIDGEQAVGIALISMTCWPRADVRASRRVA